MFAHDTRKVVVFYLGTILCGVIFGTLLAGLSARYWNADTKVDVALAAGDSQVAVTGDGINYEVYICTPQAVVTYTNRIHVYCTAPAPGGISYFAYPTSDSRNANRMLSIMLTAKTLGQNLSILYDPNADGSSYGCLFQDCRPIHGIGINY